MSENINHTKVTNEEKIIIMKEIEAKTEKKVKNLILSEEILNPINFSLGKNETQTKPEDQTNSENTINILQNIMLSGSDEFKEKVGRPMTYSEMREMFG
jgi:hypothetical protein